MEIWQAEVGTKFGWESKEKSEANPELDTETPDLEDYRKNGMFCKSGLAYNSAEHEATCVETSKITFKDAEL